MDWFMLTAMVIAGWAVASVFAGERVVRVQQAAAAAAAKAKRSKPRPVENPAAGPVDAATPHRIAA